MARIRTDNVFGTTTDNPLTNVATTINSAGLANLGVVAAPDEAIIILDPNRLTGAPEIIVVTAHTGSATSATIVRHQFGTAAREHAAGTQWVHGPIASNASTFVTAADDQGDFVPMGAWESYTPTLTNLTLGNGTQTARFTRVGRTIHVDYNLVLGTTSAVGTNPTISVPVAAAASGKWIGAALLLDASVNDFPAVVRLSAGSSSAAPVQTSGGGLSATSPFTWTTSDGITFSLTYEAAS